MRTLPETACTGIALAPTLVATVIEDGAVLLDLDSKYFYALNRSGWATVQVFEACGASEDRILAQCRAWGAADDDEVRAFLAQLSREGIVEPAIDDGGASSEPEFSGPWEAPVVTRMEQPLQSIVTSAFDPSIPLAE